MFWFDPSTSVVVVIGQILVDENCPLWTRQPLLGEQVFELERGNLCIPACETRLLVDGRGRSHDGMRTRCQSTRKSRAVMEKKLSCISSAGILEHDSVDDRKEEKTVR